MPKTILYRGGADPERLYLKDLILDLPGGEHVVVKKSNFPGIDNKDMVARHVGRYGLVALFCRPGQHVLDFPCGSGYGSEFLKVFDVHYDGQDIDPATIAYAQHVYGSDKARFKIGDLSVPKLNREIYDTIGCIEGLEHIGLRHQGQLIEKFTKALKKGGNLIVSSPENPSGVSGQSVDNPYHKGELIKSDFLSLLHERFNPEDVDLVTYQSSLTTRAVTRCFYAVCHKK